MRWNSRILVAEIYYRIGVVDRESKSVLGTTFETVIHANTKADALKNKKIECGKSTNSRRENPQNQTARSSSNLVLAYLI